MPFSALPFESGVLEFPAPQVFQTLPLPGLGPAIRDRIVGCLDLTTLAGDDTVARVDALSRRALETEVAAVCIYPVFIETARAVVGGSKIGVATVAAGFPHGLSPFVNRVAEVAEADRLGADEIDVVIRREHALSGEWAELHAEISAFRLACPNRTLKVILATGELGEPNLIFQASMVAMLAGADFIKTSTGKEVVNATLAAGDAMASAILKFAAVSGRQVGLKAAGGIRTADEAQAWWALVKDRLGEEWLNPKRFRIGASTLLDALLNSSP